MLPKKKTSSGFEFVSGLADGASAMPAKWSKPVFSFRFYEGEISRALIDRAARYILSWRAFFLPVRKRVIAPHLKS